MSDIIEDLLSTYKQDQSRRVALEQEAADEIQILRLQIKMLEAKNKKLAKALDEQYGTPCEQIRYQQEIQRLNGVIDTQDRVLDAEVEHSRYLRLTLEEEQDKVERLQDRLREQITERPVLLGKRDAEIERLKALLAEARDDIHDEVINRYPFRDLYPGEMRRYERDMDIVHRIDKALKDV